MNHIYKVVWSRARNCYMAVSEIAKGHSKSSGKAKAAKGGEMILASLAVAAMAFGTTAYADYDPTTNTDTLTNQRISTTMADTSKGDLKTYDHTDRNLVINWNKDNNRGDGSAIRNANVNAKNITIDADFADPYGWVNKGIISSGGEKEDTRVTRVTASDTIKITTKDDSVYTESKGSTIIDGFKNLIIESTGTGEADDTDRGSAFGIVDNGEGISIKGGKGSTVTVTSQANDGEHAAIGNSMSSIAADYDYLQDHDKYAVGKGITIDADIINIESPQAAIFSGIGKNRDFKVNLNASTIDIRGLVSTWDGSVFINPDTKGNVTITAGKEDPSGFTIGTFGKTSHVNINEKNGGTVKLNGGINSTGGSSVLINMTGDGSYINTKPDEEHNDNGWRYAIQNEGATVKLNISGNDSFIHGDMKATQGGIIDVNASGKGFSLSRSYTDSKDNNPYLLFSDNSQINLALSGNDNEISGDFLAREGGKINLSMTGDNVVINSSMNTGDYANDSISTLENDNAIITAEISGKNAKMTGNLHTYASHSTITVDFSGENGTLIGDAKAEGTGYGAGGSDGHLVWHYFEGTTLNLNMTGAHTSQKGNLAADGHDTLNANYTGTGSSLTGNANNTGIMNLTFDNQSQMTGDMMNDTKTYNDGTTFAGQLKADFSNGSRWTGNLDSTSGTAAVNLNNGSTWNGASTGNGDITLTNGSLWTLTKDSTVNSVNPDGSSVVSLAGGAKKLEVRKLGGSGGTFLMDLNYKDNNVDTYRDGGDYIIAHGGSGSAYNVSLTSGSSVNGMTDGSKLYFASTAADSSTFRMNQAVQVENYKKIYNKNLIVKKETDASGTDLTGYDDWFLTPDTSKGNGGNTINPNGIVPGSAANAAFALWRDDDTLLKRLGELRYDQQDDGIWARMVNKHLERDGSHGFKGNYKTIQVGYDKKKETENNGSWYYGGAISHLWGDTNYTDGHGSQKETDLSLYGTNIRPHGHYLDLIARVGCIDSDYTTSYGDHGKFENWGMSLGAEYGRQKALGGGWSIEPQVQLTYHYLWGDDYTTRNGAKVNQDNADSLVGRLGFVLSREFNGGTDHAGRVYLKASILHDFLGDTASTITDDISYHDDDDLGDTWYVAGIGTDINLGKNTRFYFDAERNFNADVKMKYRFNAGLRFGF